MARRTSTRAQQRPSGATPRARAVKALILLAGSVRRSELGKAIGRSLLDLPVQTGRTILDLWYQHALALTRLPGCEQLAVRAILNRDTPVPTAPGNESRPPLTLERDPADFRGPAGVLRDVTAQYNPDDLVLVGDGAQVLLEPLDDVVAALLAARGDLCLAAYGQGTPGGLMLARCHCFQAIASTGFVDFKEQALPRIAAAHVVRVVRRPQPWALPVRTLAEYLTALRRHHQRQAGLEPGDDPFVEDWRCAFSVIEPGATVEVGARVHESVVLRGGRVDRGAVVARSLVCSGGVVPRAQTLVDRLVAGPALRPGVQTAPGTA